MSGYSKGSYCKRVLKMDNKCPKCGIDLNCLYYKDILIMDSSVLAIKDLFCGLSLKRDIEELKKCNLCGASISEIILDGL